MSWKGFKITHAYGLGQSFKEAKWILWEFWTIYIKPIWTDGLLLWFIQHLVSNIVGKNTVIEKNFEEVYLRQYNVQNMTEVHKCIYYILI